MNISQHNQRILQDKVLQYSNFTYMFCWKKYALKNLMIPTKNKRYQNHQLCTFVFHVV